MFLTQLMLSLLSPSRHKTESKPSIYIHRGVDPVLKVGGRGTSLYTCMHTHTHARARARARACVRVCVCAYFYIRSTPMYMHTYLNHISYTLRNYRESTVNNYERASFARENEVGGRRSIYSLLTYRTLFCFGRNNRTAPK